MTNAGANVAGEANAGRSGAGRETRRLRLFFLAPLLLVLLATEIVLLADIYRRQQRDLDLGVVRVRTSAANLYDESLKRHTQALEMMMQVLARDETLRAALAARDRGALLARAEPMFEDMKRTYGVTHFYFNGPDRVNLLRVHQPERCGDVIERVTTRLAERSATTAHGVELGPLGTFTLRLVSPWYAEGGRGLLGYVELGMEIDDILEDIHKLYEAQVLVAVRKEYLDRAGWEIGMRMLGRLPDWDRFPHVVLSAQSTSEIPLNLAERLVRDEFGNVGAGRDALLGRAPFRTLFLPLQDAVGNSVAEMALLMDVSKEQDSARHALYLSSLADASGGVVLFVFFYGLVGWVGRRIDRDQQALQRLASHDGLTGLYNHRAFYEILEREIARGARYVYPVAVLMLDIDRFKSVNDTYGHTAGDRILAELARLLQQSVRRVDSVCRYGGEEISIILPEMNAEAAVQVAERLRALIEKTAFDVGGPKTHIAVSIGIGALPEQVSSLQELVSAADTALYAAKQAGRNRVTQYEKTAGGLELYGERTMAKPGQPVIG